MSPLFDTVLVANRGEIACRVIATLRSLGIRSVAVYSTADAGARHVREADTAVCIGPAAATGSYLNIDAVIVACQASGAQAVHPGYGFLSENLAFAQALSDAGITFIGPNIEALNVMGDKIRSKNHVAAAGVPVVPGISEPGLSDADLIAAAPGIGYPLLIKPSAGGGGKGMVNVFSPGELPAALATARRVAASSFGDDTLFLERLVANPRHIEVQILGDTFGAVVHLGERECSLQRRHQKVIEEAPSPLLTDAPDGAAIRARLGAAACAAAASVNYTGAGTVEFIVSNDAPDEFFFMEMNTRLQVEHPVTEMVVRVSGESLDLVEWQVRIAAGEALDFDQDAVSLEGHATEARVYAENPAEGFLPATGTVVALDESVAGREGVRVDSSLMDGLEISANYDPMLAKVIAWGADRAQSLSRLDQALAHYLVLGLPTNIEYLRLLLADPHVQAGHLDTNLIERKLPGMKFRAISAKEYAVAPWALDAKPTSLAQVAARQAGQAGAPAAEPPRPWERSDGWRLGEPEPWRSVWAAPGRTGVVTVSGNRGRGVMEGPGVVNVSGLGEGPQEVSADGLLNDYHFAHQGDTVFLGSGGWSVELVHLDRDAATARMIAGLQRADAAADPQLRSPMPGTVTVVNAATGQRVEAGDVLLAVEAMKMEHQIVAPMAGTVHIGVAVGVLVKADQIVASIQEDTPEGE
ncbi:acetyl/propionyl/methylcrotonyl-CoA carboxylase subunit alpha [Arthrobacter psychrochitiniphilus]|uniref:biotin carboxylase n=1 Tax=Arthrobacter psychrochitiniphilus TaxID=291045 RepID=A0A2V3DW54_9MICC|nr:biotin carboxylase N-terminal domain-containing protein [Arthrobacter psychrochitiniphilus]NYG16800.1 acetyl-CoA/propionyl-CoA carboxylase biotin carboxyl carrier protein [Arthrobacter psychrochitiniphilus]PXA69608.1 acetyl/propionyl-CoA carboxylase subunit alpha [Arthrobacter psychrochitiniphilus]